MKTVEREQARVLRRDEGRSVKEIASVLGVARSTFSIWVRDIELTPEQHEALRLRNPIYNGHRAGAAANATLARARRRRYQEEGRRRAREADGFYAAGCMLYWAEGHKARNKVGFTNSDPDMMRFFLSFLRTYFRVPHDKIAVSCNVHVDDVETQQALERFWLEALGLPQSCLRKSIVNRRSKWSTKRRTNVLPYGTCRLTVGSTHMSR